MRSIAFTAENIIAIRAKRKWQTRRIITPQPEPTSFAYLWKGEEHGEKVFAHTCCPYGPLGAQLLVKEAAWMWCERKPNGTTPSGRQKWLYVPLRSAPVKYCADYPEKPHLDVVSPDTGNQWGWRKKLPRFLPAWACRTTLEITGLRVQQLHGICGDDCLAEGVSQDWLEALLTPSAYQCEEAPEHWIHGSDESVSYCESCCKKEVQRLLQETPDGDYAVAGGYGSEGDSTPFCEHCQRRLRTSLTGYGAEQEFAHFLEHGVDLCSPDDCCSLINAVQALTAWSTEEESQQKPWEAAWQFRQRLERHSTMYRVAYRVLWESIHGEGSWDANPYVWVITFKLVEAAA